MKRARNRKLNVALKVAMFQTGHTQRLIARRALIPEHELSRIVWGHCPATPKQRQRLARVLQCEEYELFPGEEAANGSAIESGERS